jgi:hypothetical protein
MRSVKRQMRVDGGSTCCASKGEQGRHISHICFWPQRYIDLYLVSQSLDSCPRQGPLDASRIFLATPVVPWARPYTATSCIAPGYVYVGNSRETPMLVTTYQAHTTRLACFLSLLASFSPLIHLELAHMT